MVAYSGVPSPIYTFSIDLNDGAKVALEGLRRCTWPSEGCLGPLPKAQLLVFFHRFTANLFGKGCLVLGWAALEVQLATLRKRRVSEC